MIADIVKQLKDHIDITYSTGSSRYRLRGNVAVLRNGNNSTIEYNGGILVDSIDDTVQPHVARALSLTPDAARVIEDVRGAAQHLTLGTQYGLQIDDQGNVTLTANGDSFFINRESERLRLIVGQPSAETFRF